MKKIGQFFQRLILYAIAAVFILNFRRLFGSGRFSFFPIVMIVALVFLIFAWGMMQTMFAGADDSPARKGETPAGGKAIEKKAPSKPFFGEEDYPKLENEESPKEYTPRVLTVTLPAKILTVPRVKLTPLRETGIDLEEFCRLFNEASKEMKGDINVDVFIKGTAFTMELHPSESYSEPPKAAPRPDYKKIASDIGTEAELREIERQEREELKRLNKG